MTAGPPADGGLRGVWLVLADNLVLARQLAWRAV